MVLGKFQPSSYYGLGCGPNTEIEKRPEITAGSILAKGVKNILNNGLGNLKMSKSNSTQSNIQTNRWKLIFNTILNNYTKGVKI